MLSADSNLHVPFSETGTSCLATKTVDTVVGTSFKIKIQCLHNCC